MQITSKLDPLDWGVVLAYLAIMLVIGLALHRRSSRNLTSFFTSDRNLPWWLAGASLIATSFASDTPLWITGLVRSYGIHAVWQYWTYFLGAGLAVFLFSRMWRRAGVITDNEVLEIRYAGRGAAFIRGFNAGWVALVLNVVTIGWVTKAMETILKETLGLDDAMRPWALAVVVVITLVYCAVSGLFGVVITDAIQLVLAMVGTLSLAWIAVGEVGGIGTLVEKLQAMKSWPGHTLGIGPQLGTLSSTPPGALSFWNFIALLGFSWLGLSYCSGYICQRLLACKDEGHASKAMLSYTCFYWGFLAWPWILVALCSLVLLTPEQVGTNQEAAYPIMVMTYLPSGLRGILFVALLAAFMSTISTLINFGASYVVNDLYKRFLVRTREDGHYVNVSRVVTVVLAVGGALVSYASDSVLQLLTIAGAFTIGAVLIPLLRWFWWRMSAWGEFAAFLVSVGIVVLMLGFKVFDPFVAEWLPLLDAEGKAKAFSSDWDYYGLRILVVMVPCTLAAVATSLLTRPADADTLRRFIQLLRPPAFAWRRVAERLGVVYEPGETGVRILGGWLAMTACIASLLFCIGDLCLGRSLAAGIELVVFLATLTLCLRMSGHTRTDPNVRK